MRRLPLLVATMLGLVVHSAGADGDCLSDAMIVFDGSGSMGEVNPDLGRHSRIVEARAAMWRAIPKVEKVRKLGLLTYGGGPHGSCEGVTLWFPPITHSARNILAEIDALKPDGLTPLTAAVVAGAEALDYRHRTATVVVVTDGNETCGGRPCATAAALAAAARDLTIHVIGFRAVIDTFAWDNPEQRARGNDYPVTRCFADATGGLYVTTETVDELVEALTRTLGCPVISLR